MNKQIKLLNVVLENFKSIRSGEYSFGDKVTTISAANGRGKTTIVDAVMWCLFGIDSKGRSKFGLKTRDANGDEIREIPHSVELRLNVNDTDYILKRSITESVSRDLEIKNKFTYNVGGENVTAGDYAKAVDKICQLDVFQSCSMPSYFVSQPWEKQREFLMRMTGELSTKDIVGDDAELNSVVKEIEERGSVEQVLKHYGYTRREVMASLDDIPVRLAELEKVKPEECDWDEIEKQRAEVEKEREEVNQNLYKAKNGDSDMVANATLRKNIAFAQKRLDNMEISMRNQVVESTQAYDADLRNATRLVAETEDFIKDLKGKESSLNEIVARCEEALVEMEKENEKGAAEWNEIKNLKWTWNTDGDICPVCGQYYPQDKIEEMMKASEYKFNTEKAKRKENCIKRAAEIKDQIKVINDNIDNYKAQLKENAEQIATAEKVLAEKVQHKEDLQNAPPKTYQELLEANENYKQVSEEIEKLQSSYEAPADEESNEIVEQLEKEKADLDARINELSALMMKKETFERVQGLIAKVQEDKKKLQEQLDGIETMIDLATRYNLLSCKMLEDKVNEKFSFVKWSMFRRNLDGTPKSYCECSHNGIPFSDLNTAAQINAGLDICRVISGYYGVSVPVFVDGAESVNEVSYDAGQQIRLAVSLDNELKFSTSEN